MNVNINAYNRLTRENLYKFYINPDCYINQKYYVKKDIITKVEVL